MVISQGNAVVPLGMGSFVPQPTAGYTTTTNAKDHGKRSFNFSMSNTHTQSSAMQQNQMLQQQAS